MSISLASYVTAEPWPHQNRAFDYLLSRRHGALFADMGCGKSLVAIGLIGHNNAMPWLIVCPLAMVETWKREIERFAAYPVKPVALTGSTKKRVEALHAERNEGDEVPVFITNYESLVQANFWSEIEWKRWGGLILDESHRIKSHSSQTTKKLTRLAKQVPLRYILTGTPAADKPLDVFAQFRFLDPSILGQYWTPFLHRYTRGIERVNAKQQTRYYEILDYINQEELNRKIYQHAFRVTNEVLNLPPTTDTVIPVELSTRERTAYRKMLRESVVALGEDDSEFATAGNVLARLLRLQQITSGFLRPESLAGEDEKPVEVLGNSKQRALVDLLEDMPDEPVVVFYRFSQDAVSIHAAAKKADRPSFELSGKVNQLREWQEDDGNSVIAVQIRAGGSGVSTVRASKVVYYSLTYSLTDFQQSRARSHRPGQDRPVSYYTILAQDSVDELILEALRAKQTDTRYLIDELRKHFERASR